MEEDVEQKIRVLLADDHAVVRQGVCQFLTEDDVLAENSIRRAGQL